MPLKYYLGWFAAVWLISSPSIGREYMNTTEGAVFCIFAAAGISFGLARLGWRLGWFRKRP